MIAVPERFLEEVMPADARNETLPVVMGLRTTYRTEDIIYECVEGR